MLIATNHDKINDHFPAVFRQFQEKLYQFVYTDDHIKVGGGFVMPLVSLNWALSLSLSLFLSLSLSHAYSNPDVMLESYFEHPGSAIYFFLYLIVTVYFITNVVR